MLLLLVFVLAGCGDASIVTANLPGADDPSARPEEPPLDGDSNPNPGLLRECDSPAAGWIFCDDFEQDRLHTYFAHNSAGGRFTRASGVGVEGSSGMRTVWEPGLVSVGTLQVMIGRNPVTSSVAGDPDAKYREIYWRMYVKHQDGFVGGGTGKLSRATVMADSDWRQAMIGHVWSGKGEHGGKLVIDPASGTDPQGNVITDRYNDFDNLRWLGLRGGRKGVYEAPGAWFCVEAHVRLNDAGESNGEFTLWVDDQLDVRRSDLNWLGAYSAYGLNAVFFENYWDDGSPVTQERYFDNIVISTERIGCGEA